MRQSLHERAPVRDETGDLVGLAGMLSRDGIEHADLGTGAGSAFFGRSGAIDAGPTAQRAAAEHDALVGIGGRHGPILIACECSGVMREAFRARGVDAVSCDLKPAEDGSPYHIQGDVRDHLSDGWAGMIAHPECRYLCGSGLHWNSRGKMVDGRPRAELTAEAVEFALALWNAPISLVALENSVGILSRPEYLGPPDHIVQPYLCGDDASKATCWWTRGGLPRLDLRPHERRDGRWVEWPRGSGRMVERWSNQTDSGQNRLPPSESRSADRARTYPGIAEVCARSWAQAFISASQRAAA